MPNPPFVPVLVQLQVLCGRVAVESQTNRTAGDNFALVPEPQLTQVVVAAHDERCGDSIKHLPQLRRGRIGRNRVVIAAF